jgi:hypothetical protein
MGTLKPDRAADQLLTAPKLRPVISGGAGWLLGTALIWVVLALALLAYWHG